MHKIIQHPLISHKLSQLRNKDTCTKDFREILEEIAGLMVYEISRDLPVEHITVETPLMACSAEKLARDIILVPILRAGLGMVDGITNLVPNAKVGHVGMYRDHDTLEPREYYAKLPPDVEISDVIILDPMLATGGSASSAIAFVKNHGAKHIKLVCIVGAPEGVNRIETDHPDVEIYLASLDDRLNDVGYILPGLGDAGDRLFGTR